MSAIRCSDAISLDVVAANAAKLYVSAILSRRLIKALKILTLNLVLLGFFIIITDTFTRQLLL